MGPIQLTFSLSYTLLILRNTKHFPLVIVNVFNVSNFREKLLNRKNFALKTYSKYWFYKIPGFLLLISKDHPIIFSTSSFNNTNPNSLHLYSNYISSISHVGKCEQEYFIVTKSNIKFQKICKSLDHEHNHKFIKPNLL